MNYKEPLHINGFNSTGNIHVDVWSSGDATEEQIEKFRKNYEDAKRKVKNLGGNLTQADLPMVLELARNIERTCAYYVSCRYKV